MATSSLDADLRAFEGELEICDDAPGGQQAGCAEDTAGWRASAPAGVEPADRGRGWESVAEDQCVVDVADVGARLAKDHGVSVRVGAVAPLAVLGDSGALRRALLNLVENGVKYTPAGGRVELAVAEAGGHAVIAVEDTGPGIDPRDAERIFEPFVRLDAARDRESGGSGLGLAIARSIVVAHRGELAVERAEPGGSRFTIRLPLA